MSTVREEEIQSLSALIKSMLNSQLKTILRHEHLAVSGVKNALQYRILGRELSPSLCFPCDINT